MDSWVALYCILAVTRSILNGNMFKNGVLAPIFNFSVHTGSRVSVSKMSYHAYDQAWAYAVWISKIRPLVLRILAKNLFPSKPEVDFQRQHFPSSLRSNLNICRLNFENPSISSHVISKKSFSVQTGSRFSATTIFCHHFDWTWKYAVWILKICPILLMLWAKNPFPKVIFDFPGQTGSRF